MIRRLIWLCILLLLLLVGSRSSQPVQAGLWFTQTGVLGKILPSVLSAAPSANGSTG